MHRKKIFFRKRLIALLALLCASGALLTGGIFAFYAHANTVKEAQSKLEQRKEREEEASFVHKLSPAQQKALLAAGVETANGAKINEYASALPGQEWQSQITLGPGSLSDTTTSASGYIYVPEGVDLALFGSTFGPYVADPNANDPPAPYNPNALSVEKLNEVFEQGGWTSAIYLQIQEDGQSGSVPLMGFVNYSSGEPVPWTTKEIQLSGMNEYASVQNQFLSDCMGYTWHPRVFQSDGSRIVQSYGGPKADETTAPGLVNDKVMQSLIEDLNAGKEDEIINSIEDGLNDMGYDATEQSEVIKELKTLLTSPQFKAFEENEENIQDANDLISQTSIAKDLPTICQAVWTGEVSYYEDVSVGGNHVSLPAGEYPEFPEAFPAVYSYGNNLPNDWPDSTPASNWANPATGPMIPGCGTGLEGSTEECGIRVDIGQLGCQFMFNAFGSSFSVEASYYVSSTLSSSPAFSSPGVVIQNSLSANDYFANDILVRQTGTSSDNFNPTSSSVSFTPGTSSSSGLWFKAEDRDGKPLKEVTITLNYSENPSCGSSGCTGTSQTNTEGFYIQPYPFTGPNYQGSSSYSGPSELSSALSSRTSNAEGGLIGYYWSNTGWPSYEQMIDQSNGVYETVSQVEQTLSIPLNQISGQEGVFELSGLPFGVYQVQVLSGETQNGTKISYGSYYSAPTFQVSLNTGSGSDPFSSIPAETMKAVSDPCGFVNPKEDEVVIDSQNPSTQGGSSASSLSSADFTSTVGPSFPYYYQALSYLPFDVSDLSNASGASASSTPLSFSLYVPGQKVIESSVKIDGKALTSQGSLSSTSSGVKIDFSPSYLSSLFSSSGSHVLSVSWSAYLTPSFSSSSSSWYEFNYSAYSSSNPNDQTETLEPLVETNGPASADYSSLSPSPSSPSSETGLWWRELQADGSPASGAQFTVKNSSGSYLVPDMNNGSFLGWEYSSSPHLFSQNQAGLFGFGGLSNGAYTVTLVKFPDSVSVPCSSGLVGCPSYMDTQFNNNWPSVKAPEGYPSAMGWSSADEVSGSFQVKLSYSSPEDLSALADPMGLIDSEKDAMYSPSPILMNVMDGSSFSSSSKAFEPVGGSFTEGWEGYLPMAVTDPDSANGKLGYDSSMTVSLSAGKGLEINSSDFDSAVQVAGVPLSTLLEEGASASSSSTGATIDLPYSSLSYLEENGKNAAGSALSSSSDREIYITFPSSVTNEIMPEERQFNQGVGYGKFWAQSASWLTTSYPIYAYVPVSSLPLTGGKPLALILALSSFFLLLLGALVAVLKKKGASK